MQSIEQFLIEISNVERQVEISRQRYAPQLAPHFNIFHYIDANELMLSKILADLLNPFGAHAQGGLFIEKFLRFLSSDWLEVIDFNGAYVEVRREERTKASETQRSMDIYILIKDRHGKTFSLCIENKPYAQDQPHQLVDYYEELERRQNDFIHLIYLKNDGSYPDQSSVPETTLNEWLLARKITILAYADLIDWLSLCISQIKNHRVEMFLKEFIGFIQKRFLGVSDMSEKHEILNVMMRGEDSIKAAFVVANSMHKLKEELMQSFLNDLNAACRNRGWMFSHKPIKGMNKPYFGFLIQLNELSEYGFCMEFFEKDLCGALFGLRRCQAFPTNQVDETFLILRDFLIKNQEWQFYQKSLWWPAHTLMKDTHWLYQPEPWIAIQNGSLVQTLIEQADQLFELLRAHDKLDVL